MRSQLPDELLARRAAYGNVDDFEELLRRYRTRVYRVCYHVAGNAEDAEDWAQECFVRVYRQLARYDAGRPFAPWMIRVVSNTCVNLAKARQGRDSKVAAGLDEQWVSSDSGADPLRVALRTHEARQVQAAVTELGPQMRQAIALRIVEGLSLHDLAETLGVPLQTAASRVRRALIQIREKLDQAESEVER